MNNRRKIIVALATAASIPHTVFAQPKKPPVLIGLLGSGVRNELKVADFKEEMATLGWQEGASYMFEAHWVGGVRERLPSVAEELAAKKPAVIVTTPASATIAATKAAPQVPIVQASGASPVDLGLAASLSRPGGMVTGLTSIDTEVSVKYLELLLAAAPKLKRIGFLIDRLTPGYAAYMKNSRRAIEHFRVEGRFVAVAKAEEIEPAIARLAKEGVEGLVVVPAGSLFSSVRQRIVTLALAHHWLVITNSLTFAEEGALLTYSAVVSFRRAAYYVDRILKGTMPSDLAIEQPTKFEMVVNMKTAKALDLKIPNSILVQATKVIE